MTGTVFVPLIAALVAVAAGCAHHQEDPGSAPIAARSGGAIAAPATAPQTRGAYRANAAASHTDSTTVNKYLSYDSSDSTVYLKLVAAATSALGGLNFNGGSSGDQTITVPVGWTVDIDFLNEDAIPHSAIVIDDQKPIPAAPTKAAFPRAYTAHLFDGLSPQTGHDTMQFKADQAGHYLIACGVPGHAVSGMYINFVVSPTASTPTNAGTIGPP
jgi:sulfocyanin